MSLRGAIQDVTERKQRMQELERSYDLLERTQAIADVGGWEVNPETDDLRWTDETYRIHGLPVGSDVAFDDVVDLVLDDDLGIIEDAFRDAVADDDSFDVEFRIETPAGERKWVRTKGEAVTRDGDRIVRGTIQNVTQRVEREQAVRESRERLEVALDASNAGVWDWDLDTGEVMWHESSERLFGVDPGSFEGTFDAFQSFVHPDDRDRVEEAVETAVTETGILESEFRIERTDGEQRWIAVTGRVLYDEGGGPTRLLGVGVDVTERKSRKQDLERSHDLLERTQAIADVGGWSIDPETLEVFWTDQVYEILGLPVGEEPPLADALDVYHPDDRPTIEAAVETALDDHEHIDERLRVVRPSGEVRWVRVLGEPEVVDGEVASLRGAFQDVTDRIDRQRDLERYEAIVTTAADPVYVLDESGHVTMANEAMVEQFALGHGDLIGTPMRDLIGAEQAREAEREIASMLRQGDDQRTLTFTLTTPTRGRRTYEVNVSILWSDGEFAGTVGVAREVTALLEREQRLSVLDRVLRHNIRNKLNVVVGRADALTGIDDGTVRDNARAIINACDELLELSETARRFEATVHADGTDAELIDLGTHLPHVVEEANTSYPDASVALDVDDPPLWVDAHRTLELAVEEVIENAIVHSGGSPSVHVTANEDSDSGVVELRVADDGPGLDDVDRQALERGIETPLEHMTGLGLWFVRWTVESSGGTLTIEDNDPRGTVVVFRLPGANRPDE
ncbi:PAS domain-containing protein [Halorarius halobius]|uniref:PAS domain-containing protein n=1 Tax=Halorarius halobius TaxID=2962671 RepID=UPI0020CE05AA|nr:PAS domain-containing protein [Halorarius halobius]